jgi:hypothetical protein
MFKKWLTLIGFVLVCSAAANAQKADVTVTLNEAFFDALFDAVYHNFDAPEFVIGTQPTEKCSESIRILRERGRVKTAFRFRGGNIVMPLAFTGRYDPPLLGCMDFAGTAEAILDVEFDRENQRLIARAKARDVNLAGTGGIGGSLVARLVQGTLDRRLNPIEIIRLDKLGFIVPVLDKGNLRMTATAARTEVVNSTLNITITYEFSRP